MINRKMIDLSFLHLIFSYLRPKKEIFQECSVRKHLRWKPCQCPPDKRSVGQTDRLKRGPLKA